MAENYLLSSAYFPPVEYMSLIVAGNEIFIEKEESYLKQTFRNRCYILSSNGPMALSVPVLLGSFHKTQIKNIKIDYSKRWQQVHLRALMASYRASAFYEYFYENIENVIKGNHTFLLDLNMHSLETIQKIIGSAKKISFTSFFQPDTGAKGDFRYIINPKKKAGGYPIINKEYYQVFNTGTGFVPGLSAIDLIFNLGPESLIYLKNGFPVQKSRFPDNY
jgi:hypothetical protein